MKDQPTRTTKGQEFEIRDNGGRTADRYIVRVGSWLYTMSENASAPNGVCQSYGDVADTPDWRDLGVPIDLEKLPESTQRAIRERVADHDRERAATLAQSKATPRMTVCQDCGVETAESNLTPLDEMHDLLERVSAGEIMPAGECRQCGAVAHYTAETDDTPDCAAVSCPGWDVFESGVGESATLEIQRCDDCKAFPDDESAIQAALQCVSDSERFRRRTHGFPSPAQWLGDVPWFAGMLKALELIRDLTEQGGTMDGVSRNPTERMARLERIALDAIALARGESADTPLEIILGLLDSEGLYGDERDEIRDVARAATEAS